MPSCDASSARYDWTNCLLSWEVHFDGTYNRAGVNCVISLRTVRGEIMTWSLPKHNGVIAHARTRDPIMNCLRTEPWKLYLQLAVS